MRAHNAGLARPVPPSRATEHDGAKKAWAPDLWCPAMSKASTIAAQYHRAGQLKFLGKHAALTNAQAFAPYLAPLRNREWVVYSKRPFGGPAEVLRYLARYTQRHQASPAPACGTGARAPGRGGRSGAGRRSSAHHRARGRRPAGRLRARPQLGSTGRGRNRWQPRGVAVISNGQRLVSVVGGMPDLWNANR